MRRLAALVVSLGAAVSLAACGDKDASLCNFYKSLGAGYTQHQGYIPSDVQDSIDKYC